MTECPDADTLAAFDSLAERERMAIADHAASCETCRVLVSDLLGVTPAKSELAQIARYRVDRCIGAGAMGTVYAGFDPELARPVAIKVLHSGGSPERMKREARALAKLAHPNVVGVYDVGEHDSATFVAMALVDGENMRVWLKTERTTAQIVDAIVQAARGVEAAHAHGIVHRDLKPDNIFIARTGEVLVGDFGLATSHVEPTEGDANASPSTLTQDGAVIGTPAYMAPEQIAGEPSAASDQFALCVTAWEALYGGRPFRGDDLAALGRAVEAGVRDEPSTRVVPAHVHAAIRRGLSADPAARHPSMSALIAALTARRRRWPYVGVGFAALAVAGGVALAMRTGDEPETNCANVEPPAWTAPEAPKPMLRATLARVLESNAAPWTQIATSSCAAVAKRELSEPIYRATLRCLERRRFAIDTVVTAKMVPIATLETLESIEPVESCRTATSSPDTPELAGLQRELDTLVALLYQVPPQPAALEALDARAKQLGDPATLAELHYVRALADDHRGLDPTPQLQQTVAAAERARDDRMRARAAALLARVAIRGSRLDEGRQHRDVAAAAVERVGDPLTTIAVERSTIALAFARGDVRAEIEALQRIEKVALDRFGDLSKLLVDTRFQLASALYRAKDPGAATMLELAASGTKQLTDVTPFDELEQESFAKRSPSVRIPIEERALAIARLGNSESLAQVLRGLGYDYELVGAWDRALAANREALTLELPEPALAAEFRESAANAAFEIADRTDDKRLRADMLEQALVDLDRLPAGAAELDSIRSLRGRILLLGGRYLESIPHLSAALAAAERSEPQHPYRIAMRSFALAQALWEVGGARDRDRARALAEDAAKRMPDARAMYAADAEAYGGHVQRVEDQAARVDTWRRTHR
ncbi:MAG: protein kinase domain-containing protein [Kofleriaceae bacterium]